MIGCRQLGRMGRLGNQLFQIASTMGIGYTAGDEVVFPEDWIYRAYFSLPDRFFNDELLQNAHESTGWATHLDERCRPYLQDVRLFDFMLPRIRELFEPSSTASYVLGGFVTHLEAWARLQRPILAVHVRRGDLAHDPGNPLNVADYHLLMSREYYERGISMVWPEPPGSIAVFSDDIEWCRQNIDADWYSVGISHPKEQEAAYWTSVPQDFVDLFLLSQCDYYVITGSTFGIWGALLADVPDNHVVRPSKVYGPALSFIDSELLFPSGWRVAYAP